MTRACLAAVIPEGGEPYSSHLFPCIPWEKCPCNHTPNFYPWNLATSSGQRESGPLAATLAGPLDSHSIFKALSTKRKLQCIGEDELSSAAVLRDQGSLYVSSCSASFRYQHHTRQLERQATERELHLTLPDSLRTLLLPPAHHYCVLRSCVVLLSQALLFCWPGKTLFGSFVS